MDPHLKNPSTLYWFFLPDSQFSPLLRDFLPIGHFTREISPSINEISVNLCVIFPHICHFHLSCQVLSVFASSPFDQGHRTDPPLHIRRTFCDLSPILSFSRCLSDFCPFSQIVILPGTSLGHSIQFPLFGNFLVRSPIFTILVRFWHILPDSLFYQKIFWSLISICVNPLVIFLAKFTTLHPPDRFSPFPPDSSFLVRLTLWQGTSHGVAIKFQSIFLWSFTISAIFNLSVRFWPFLPIRHLTRDISLSLHYIFVERFVIFRHFCHSDLACQVFAVFSRLSFYHGYLSGILFNFRYLVIFWSDLPFSPFWSGFGIFYQIRYFTKKSFGASFQFASTLWWFFLPNSQFFTLLTGSLRFRLIRRFSQFDHSTRDISRSLD